MLFLCFFQLVVDRVAFAVALRDGRRPPPRTPRRWRLLPLTFMIPLGAFISGRMDARRPARTRPQQIFGTAVARLSALLGLAFISPVHAFTTGVLMTVPSASSIGIVMPSSMVAVQNAVPRSQLGIATAGTVVLAFAGWRDRRRVPVGDPARVDARRRRNGRRQRRVGSCSEHGLGVGRIRTIDDGIAASIVTATDVVASVCDAEHRRRTRGSPDRDVGRHTFRSRRRV